MTDIDSIRKDFESMGYSQEYSGDDTGHRAKLMFDMIKRLASKPDQQRAGVFSYTSIDNFKKCLYDARDKVEKSMINKNESLKLLFTVTPHLETIGDKDAVCMIIYLVNILDTKTGKYISSFTRTYKFRMHGMIIREDPIELQKEIIKYYSAMEESRSQKANIIVSRLLSNKYFGCKNNDDYESVKSIENDPAKDKALEKLIDNRIEFVFGKLVEAQESQFKAMMNEIKKVPSDIMKNKGSWITYITRYCLAQTMAISMLGKDPELFDINIEESEVKEVKSEI